MPYYQDFQKKNARSAKREWEDERPRSQKRGYRGDDAERADSRDRRGRDDNRRLHAGERIGDHEVGRRCVR